MNKKHQLVQRKIEKAHPRSGKWPSVRREFLQTYPRCAVCDGTRKLNVHHIRPFHLHPDLELDPTNFITLCEDDDNGINCHLAIGHLGSFNSYNEQVEKDAPEWNKKIKSRPK